jgi:hypothetical protein
MLNVSAYEELKVQQVNFSYLKHTVQQYAIPLSWNYRRHAAFLFKHSDTYKVWPWWSRLDPGCIPLLGSSRYWSIADPFLQLQKETTL